MTDPINIILSKGEKQFTVHLSPDGVDQLGLAVLAQFCLIDRTSGISPKQIQNASTDLQRLMSALHEIRK